MTEFSCGTVVLVRIVEWSFIHFIWGTKLYVGMCVTYSKRTIILVFTGPRFFPSSYSFCSFSLDRPKLPWQVAPPTRRPNFFHTTVARKRHDTLSQSFALIILFLCWLFNLICQCSFYCDHPEWPRPSLLLSPRFCARPICHALPPSSSHSPLSLPLSIPTFKPPLPCLRWYGW